MGTHGVHTSVAKPDFVAPDCVDVTGSGGFGSPFCGTSAAAPHIAGLVALMVSGYPGTSPYKLLQESAIPKGKPVPNGQYGYGLPNMQTLLNKVKPTPKKSSGGGGGDVDLLALVLLGLAAGARRRRRSAGVAARKGRLASLSHLGARLDARQPRRHSPVAAPPSNGSCPGTS
ncbi:MAG TPA: S8 family serine peptidase [Gammaproteobacteria bacterium]